MKQNNDPTQRRRPPAWDLRTTRRRRTPCSNQRRGYLHPRCYHLNAATGLEEKNSKATVSTHPKYSQDLHQIYTTYASVSKEWGYIFGLYCRNARIEGESQCIYKVPASCSKGRAIEHLAAFRRERAHTSFLTNL